MAEPGGATTRTRDRFTWPAGPGIMMLDHDPDGAGLSREELVALIREAAPGLADTAMLWWPSASSHICDAGTGEDLTGLRGQRLYLMVRDAHDIPRAGAALVNRLWTAGHGWIVPSAAGLTLERSAVDTCVWQPERLDFAAGAVCASGLVQRRGDPVLISGDIRIVDTRTALPDSSDVVNAATAARRQAKLDEKDSLLSAREVYLDARSQALLSPADRDDAEKQETARAVIRRAVDHAVLAADFPVEVETASGSFEVVTVGRILCDREGFHGRLTRDPLEPGYDGRRSTGKLFLLDARPTLHSFAHGGRSFRLIRASERIELVQGRLAEATEAALARLRTDPTVFDFGGQVALVEDGCMLPLDEHALGYYLAGGIQFWRSRKAAGGYEPVDADPPAKLVRQILSLGPRRRLKPLTAVVTAPTIRSDGSVLFAAGYDPETQLLLVLRDAEAAPVPSAPSRKAVARALDRLMHPFRDFPLVDDLARGGLLSALLTAVARPALVTAPAFAVDAPVQGSGKTLLASCIATLATGETPEIWPHTAGKDDEEIRKRLFAALRGGTVALIWDNVTGILDSAALAAAITAPVLRDRVLGRSESFAIPNRALLLLTGNNFCPAGDLPRRIIRIRIDPGTDVPFARRFDLDPLGYVFEHRIEMVRAALVLIRGRLSSGASGAEGRMASFETWDDLVRQTVCWIGTDVAPGEYGDPLELVRRAQASDLEQESLFALVEALDELFSTAWFTARDVAQRASRGRSEAFASSGETALAEALTDIAGERALGSTKSIGRTLQFRQGRIVYGRRLLSRQGRNGLEYRIGNVGDRPRCGFGGFGGFESGDLDCDDAGLGRSPADDGSEHDSDWPETNPPNPPNPHTPDHDDVVEEN